MVGSRKRQTARLAVPLIQQTTQEGLAQAFLEAARQVLPFDVAAIWLADVQTGQLCLVAEFGLSLDLTPRLKSTTLDASLIESITAQTGRLQAIADLSEAQCHTALEQSIGGGEAIRSLVCWPLKAHDQLVGVITCATRQVRRFSPSELETMGALGDVFAAALHNVRLHEQLQTERTRLETFIRQDLSRLKEAERLREEFVSIVTHDLREPITVISGFASILERLPPDQHNTEVEHRAVESIKVSARRLTRMVSDLLDASRIESRRLNLSREVFDLAALVRALVDRSVEMIANRPVRIQALAPEPLVYADPARVDQVLTNLLSNACKYSYPDSEISIQIASQANEAVIAVSNYGPGISPDDQPEVFGRHFRTRTAAKREGLGLGLYIARGLVEAHGGRIWLESQPGQTTTFYFTLPAKPPT